MKRPKRKLKRLKPPPRTTRMCRVCKEETEFKYYHKVGHSYCLICKNRNIII